MSMKSVYFRIFLWCFGTLALCLLAFLMIYRYVEMGAIQKGGPFSRLYNLVLNESIHAYESGGAPQLADYLEHVRGFLGQSEYLTDPQGRDLVTGADRSSLLKLVHSDAEAPVFYNAQIIVAHSSPDNRYWLITILDPPIGRWTLVPYYVLMFVAVALLCWALASSIASPLRDLARSVEQFGRGELSVRLNSQRKDEIGELARSFDRMAERIGTLLTAERRLLQDVSHELRSPLARMSFAVELARRDEDRKSALAQIKEEIRRLSELVGSLLQVARSEGDPLARKQDEFSLTDLLREVAADNRIEADGRQCRLLVEAPVNANVTGDRELLKRAFENIVRNAIRYAPVDSHVDVNVVISGTTARVTTRDYGVGVPEAFVDKLGQPFLRVDDSRDNSTGGVGLGLAIAKRAISTHGGLLRIENVQPGLQVTVDLPLSETKRPASVTDSSLEPASAGPRRFQ